MNNTNQRERPASVVAADLQKRLINLEERDSFTRPLHTTLDLTGIPNSSPQNLRKAAEKLLTPKSFEDAYKLYDSLKRSAYVTEQKQLDFEEKRTRKDDVLTEKERGWGVLMESEKKRKEELLEKVAQHLWKGPKKFDPLIVDGLVTELESQEKMKLAYEKKLTEGRENAKKGQNILSSQVKILRGLGDTPVKEYLANDGRTWLVKSSELREKSLARDEEFDGMVL